MQLAWAKKWYPTQKEDMFRIRIKLLSGWHLQLFQQASSNLTLIISSYNLILHIQ